MDAPFASPDLRFIAPLGRGGTADVARVFSTRLGREAAAKYPLAAGGNAEVDFSRLAQREFELIGSLRYPGLVRILEPPHRDPDYLLLELCSGPTLDTVGRAESFADACNLISAAAAVLEYLHAVRLVHGDLKSSNFFLPPDWRARIGRGLFFVRLSDFSLGRRIDEPETSRLGAGTVGYMAPETIVDGKTSHRSDLFALGVIAYQLITGRHPFLHGESDPVRVSSRVREGDYPDPIPFRPEMSEGFADLVRRLLAVDEKDRPADAWEVCRHLETLGATYPFRKALAPWHVLGDSGYAEMLDRWIDVRPRDRAHIDCITGGDPQALKAALTATFRRGMAVYEAARYVVGRGFYWPACMRRAALAKFAALSFRQKKDTVREAVAAEAAFSVGDVRPTGSPLAVLLGGLLRPATIKRLAPAHAEAASAACDYGLAASLYLRAGNLTRAAECADQAALALEKAGDQKHAYVVLNAVFALADMTGRSFDVRLLYMTRGDIEKRAGDTEPALRSYRRLIELYDGRPPDKLLAESYKDLGDVYRMKQQTDEGLSALEKAREIYTDLGDELELSHTLNNIGNLHWLRNEWRACRKNYLKALRIQRRLNAGADIASSLSNLATAFFVEGRHARAKVLFENALAIQRQIVDRVGLARTLNNLGYVLKIIGDSQAALDYLSESLEINRAVGNKKEILFNLHNLTGVMISAGRLRESLSYLSEGITLADALDDQPSLAALHVSMGIVYKRLGRLCDALEEFDHGATLAARLDDNINSLNLAVQRASLRHAVGDRQLALDGALDAARQAEKRGLAHERLNALLLALRVDPDKADHALVLELCRQLHLPREAYLSWFAVLEAALEAGDRAKVESTLKAIMSTGKPLPEYVDIETGRMAAALGEAMILTGETELALRYLETARTHAAGSGLVPELVTIHTLLGRFYAGQNDYEACYEHLRNGLRFAKQVADSITDPEDRALYQSQRHLTYLVTQVQHLGARLSKRSR
ncbi:MAG: serine/threonine-protein kinase [candidate division Zixibacteria bacterium]|jgi:tetratricopeptide (TPR) repeat protein|nr:serine/threonine-protein kinase [candidate division Zixibacteria bacterium]